MIDRRVSGARVVLLGFGAINQRVLALLRARASAVEIVGVIRRKGEGAGSIRTVADGIPLIGDAADLAKVGADVILEAASREAVREWGAVGLSVARRFVVSSSSAFADDLLLKELRQTAAHHGSRLVLSPGAIAGIDALSAASRLSLREVRHRIVKPPSGWGSALDERERTRGGASILFSGSARECAERYPLNANVTVVSALSGIGLDATRVELVSDPQAVANRHEIHASGEFGSLAVTVENRPLQANPKSSELAALALVRLAENEVTDLVI